MATYSTPSQGGLKSRPGSADPCLVSWFELMQAAVLVVTGLAAAASWLLGGETDSDRLGYRS